jgi:hypothetical protein
MGGDSRAKTVESVARSKGPSEIDPVLISAVSQFSNPSLVLTGGLSKISQRLGEPVENWVSHLRNLNGLGSKRLDKSLDKFPRSSEIS